MVCLRTAVRNVGILALYVVSQSSLSLQDGSVRSMAGVYPIIDAEDIADHHIGEKLYARIMLRTYSDAINQNKRIVRQNRLGSNMY